MITIKDVIKVLEYLSEGSEFKSQIHPAASAGQGPVTLNENVSTITLDNGICQMQKMYPIYTR